MASLFEESRILTPPLPPLLHLSTVAVALPLLNDFCITALDRVFLEIQLGNLTTSKEGCEENRESGYNTAKERLLQIPRHLRKSVLNAVHGMHWEIEDWKSQNSSIFKYKDGERFFHWKSDGTIDTIKIAQHLVLDPKIEIRKRFEIACNYCLEKSVKILWEEIEASGKTKCYNTAGSIMVRFWVRWLREGFRVPWTQAAGEYLEFPRESSRTSLPRILEFFPSLPPEDMKFFLSPFQSSLPQDFLSCLYSVTKEEQEEILRKSALYVLKLYLNWPLQSLFLETFEKLSSFIDDKGFSFFLMYFMRLNFKGDFDYRELFRQLWHGSPSHWKECARKDRQLRMKIDSYVGGEKRNGDECVNSKRKVSSDINGKNERIFKK